MKSSASLFIAAATVVLFSTPIQAAEIAPPNWAVSLTDTYIGCFTSVGGLKLASGKEQWQSVGLCQGKCKSLNSKYCALTKKFYCYCGDTLPPESAQVKNDVCNLNCAGYPSDPCGSNSGDFTVFVSDPAEPEDRLYDPNKALPEPSSSSSSTSTTTTDAATSTVIRQEITTIVQTPTETPESTSTPEPSGINKAGAAAGAVVGVLVAISIGAGLFLLIRKQRRKKVEEEYRRSLAVREYNKKPEADLRLDPVMLQRRMSDGSIADNQDYSRRILKVTNPDGM